ncbi:hypothetical protein STENM223S_10850 [Streptomyces tendae]
MQRVLALLAVRPGHQPVTDALQRALGAVRQGMPGAERVTELVGNATAEGLLSAAVTARWWGRTYGTGCASP